MKIEDYWILGLTIVDCGLWIVDWVCGLRIVDWELGTVDCGLGIVSGEVQLIKDNYNLLPK